MNDFIADFTADIKMDKFLEIHKLSKLSHEEIIYLNSPFTITYIYS